MSIKERDETLEDKHKRHSNWSSRTKGLHRLQQFGRDMTRQVSTLGHIPKHIIQAFPSKQKNVSTSASLVSRILRSDTAVLRRGMVSKHVLTKKHKATYRHPKRLVKVATILEKQASLQRKQVLAAQAVRAASIANTPPSIARKMVEKLSRGMRSDHTMLNSIKKTLVKDRKEIFAVKQLPKGISPEKTYPSPTNLLKRRAFGKPMLSKSYCVTPSLWHVAIIIWKNVCPLVSLELAIALGRQGTAMLKRMRELKRVDFSALQIIPLDWNYEEDNEADALLIRRNKRTLHDACLLHYSMDTEAVQRFCGGRWLGEHRRTLEMLKVMTHILPDEMFLGLGAGLIDGVPNCMYGDVPNEELMANLATENLPGAMRKPALINKAIKKEEVNHLSMTFDRKLAMFTPHIGIIKLGIIEKEGKKSRMYRHGSRITEDIIQPINKICDVKKTEPRVKYGTVLKDHCQYLWSIAAHYPGQAIDLYDDDVSGAFPQQVFSPGLAKANVSLHEDIMILSVALHFGGNFGPASWESISDGRSYLATWLYRHCTYQTELNKESLDMMVFPNDTAGTHEAERCIIRPTIDEHTLKVRQHNKFIPQARMFVDDLLTAGPRIETSEVTKDGCNMKQLVAASIESGYLMIGCPGPIQKPLLPPTMSWDKMVDRAIGVQRIALGILFLTTTLELTLENYKVLRLLHIIRDVWARKRKGFTAIDAARLIGNVIACVQVCPWLQWCLHHLMEELKTLLRTNAKRLQRKVHYRDLFAEKDEKWLDPKGKSYARYILLNRSYMNEIWNCDSTTFFSIGVREEVDYIETACTEHLSGEFPWRKPISHIVDRAPDAKMRQDASTKWGAGGYCAELNYWWQIPWSDFGKEVEEGIKNKTIHINVLELVAIVINYFAAACAFEEKTMALQPRVHCGGDNTSSIAWYMKFSNPNPRARRLTRIMAEGHKHTTLGMDCEYWAGKMNYFADAISRGLPKDTMHRLFKKICPTNEECRSCLQVPSSVEYLHLKRYLLKPEFISRLVSALLLKNTVTEHNLNGGRSGHFVQGQNISFNFSNDWKWTSP